MLFLGVSLEENTIAAFDDDRFVGDYKVESFPDPHLAAWIHERREGHHQVRALLAEQRLTPTTRHAEAYVHRIGYWQGTLAAHSCIVANVPHEEWQEYIDGIGKVRARFPQARNIALYCREKYGDGYRGVCTQGVLIRVGIDGTHTCHAHPKEEVA